MAGAPLLSPNRWKALIRHAVRGTPPLFSPEAQVFLSRPTRWPALLTPVFVAIFVAITRKRHVGPADYWGFVITLGTLVIVALLATVVAWQQLDVIARTPIATLYDQYCDLEVAGRPWPALMVRYQDITGIAWVEDQLQLEATGEGRFLVRANRLPKADQVSLVHELRTRMAKAKEAPVAAVTRPA